MSINRNIALLTIRLLLGLIFFFQGFGKVFTWGVENLYKMKFFLGTYEELLPNAVIYGTAYFTSYAELIGGLLLIIGLKRDWALYVLALVLVVVTFGHGMVDPVWDLSNVMYRAILLITLLLLPTEWDRFSVDSLIAKVRK